MSKKNHFKSIEAAIIYAEKHPELKELIHSFIRMSEHPKANCKIQIGKFSEKDESFTAKLTSNIRFATTLFSFYKGEPQIFIRNHSENVCVFNLFAIGKILSQESYSVPKPLNYEKETYIFFYNGNDYELNITFEMNNLQIA